MRIFLRIAFFIFSFWVKVYASQGMDHGPQIYHSFILEGDYGKLRDHSSKYLHFKGWIGGDYNKLRLKLEDNPFKNEALLTALYSRNVSEFWDVEVGYAYNIKDKTNYFVVGAEGMLPFFIETELTLFLSEKNTFSMEVRNEVDIIVTQKLISTPYTIIELYGSNNEGHGVKSGITSVEAGIITRYELNRKFAPYFSIRYYTKTFDTRRLAKVMEEDFENYMLSIGLRLKL